jgi:hypothetical protein
MSSRRALQQRSGHLWTSEGWHCSMPKYALSAIIVLCKYAILCTRRWQSFETHPHGWSAGTSRHKGLGSSPSRVTAGCKLNESSVSSVWTTSQITDRVSFPSRHTQNIPNNQCARPLHVESLHPTSRDAGRLLQRLPPAMFLSFQCPASPSTTFWRYKHSSIHQTACQQWLCFIASFISLSAQHSYRAARLNLLKKRTRFPSFTIIPAVPPPCLV